MEKNKKNIIPESNLESGIMMIDDGTHDQYPYVKFGDKIACVPSTCHEDGLFKISLFKVEESHKINSYIDLEKYKDWENRPRIDLGELCKKPHKYSVCGMNCVFLEFYLFISKLFVIFVV